MEYKLPDYTPQEVRSFLAPIFSCIHSLLKDNLVGIYLHGSLAMGSFQLGSSDIDLIFVVNEHLSSEEKRKMIEYLNKNREKGKSFEMSVFLKRVLQNPQYPILVELRYDYPDNIFENEQDKEVLAHLYETKERGFCIWGKSIGKVFQKIPAEFYLLAIVDDLKYTRKCLLENPTYWVLNACRIMAFIKEGQVLSKLEGGEWGIENLSEKYHNLIKQAMSCYQQRDNKDQILRKKEELEDFAESVINEIENSKLLVAKRHSLNAKSLF